MEEKLEKFKRHRRKKILIDKGKAFFQGITKYIESIKSPSMSGPTEPSLDGSEPNWEVDSNSEVSSILSDNSMDVTLPCLSWLTMITYLLYFLLWVITFIIAVQFEFGYVYLIISGLVFIYFNTRTGPKKKGEISAYSVFNPNCHAIDGTLKAEQFEKEFNLIKHETNTSPH